jgi:hypothetical protein
VWPMYLRQLWKPLADLDMLTFWFLRKKADPMRKQLGKRYTNCRLGVHHVSAIASPGYQNTHEKTMRCIQNFSYTVPWRISVSLVSIWRARTAVQSTDIRGQAMRLDDRRVSHNLLAMLRKKSNVRTWKREPRIRRSSKRRKNSNMRTWKTVAIGQFTRRN